MLFSLLKTSQVLRKELLSEKGGSMTQFIVQSAILVKDTCIGLRGMPWHNGNNGLGGLKDGNNLSRNNLIDRRNVDPFSTPLCGSLVLWTVF